MTRKIRKKIWIHEDKVRWVHNNVKCTRGDIGEHFWRILVVVPAVPSPSYPVANPPYILYLSSTSSLTLLHADRCTTTFFTLTKPQATHSQSADYAHTPKCLLRVMVTRRNKLW